MAERVSYSAGDPASGRMRLILAGPVYRITGCRCSSRRDRCATSASDPAGLRNRDLVFPSERTGHALSDVALQAITKRAGVTVHEFRASFSTFHADNIALRTRDQSDRSVAEDQVGLEGIGGQREFPGMSAATTCGTCARRIATCMHK